MLWGWQGECAHFGNFCFNYLRNEQILCFPIFVSHLWSGYRPVRLGICVRLWFWLEQFGHGNCPLSQQMWTCLSQEHFPDGLSTAHNSPEALFEWGFFFLWNSIAFSRDLPMQCCLINWCPGLHAASSSCRLSVPTPGNVIWNCLHSFLFLPSCSCLHGSPWLLVWELSKTTPSWRGMDLLSVSSHVPAQWKLQN